MASRKLMLVDGLAVVYRAFYAIKDLSTKDGRPTNAVFGFIRMLKHMADMWDPTHWGVVFDGGLPEERLELLEDYKAQRPPMPDAMRDQLERCEEYLDRAGIAWTRQEGQEADDVLASVATWARPEAPGIAIATNDKDMFQMVDQTICVVPVSGKGAPMGPDGILAKTGVPPSGIVDWLSLVGDSSDNIAGVPGVGAKTAAKLLKQFGTIDAIWRQLDQVPGDKLRNALDTHRDLIRRNRDMVRLRTDLPCPFTWEQLDRRPPDPASLLPLFEDLEFHGMIRELQQQELLPE
jgi:DNA polymerase-1